MIESKRGNMMRAFIFMLFLLVLLSESLTAQVNIQGRQDLREGIRLYEEGSYELAEESFRRAIENNAGDRALYNLGNTLYAQGRFEEAMEVYQRIQQEATDRNLRSRSFYNQGNIQLEKGEIGESIESFKNALRWNPSDVDARYNLAYALNRLQQEPPPPPEQDQDEEQDENQDEQEQEESGEGEGDDDEQEQEPGDEERDEQEQDSRQDEGDADSDEQEQDGQSDIDLSPEDIERILEALEGHEQELQEKWQDEQISPADRSIEKDW
ncbi:MAG: tetratricopeptide repeat protein [Chitinophagaceae bacterium]|nr:MAG: tetratricopeptide repeat protein [Chitinophagaceae bacterium]